MKGREMSDCPEYRTLAESRIEDLADKLGIEPDICAEHFATGVLRAGESLALSRLRLDIHANRSPEAIGRIWDYVEALTARSSGRPEVVREIKKVIAFANELGDAR